MGRRMTDEDREWLEAHFREPIFKRLDRIDEQISRLRERTAKVEVKSGFVAALIAAVVAAVGVLIRGSHT